MVTRSFYVVCPLRGGESLHRFAAFLCVTPRIIPQMPISCILELTSKYPSLYANFTVVSTEYTDNGVLVEATLDERGRGMYRDLIVEDQ